MGRKPREIKIDLVLVEDNSPECLEAWRRATEVLLNIRARVDARKKEAESAQQTLDAQTASPPLISAPDGLIADLMRVAELAGHPFSPRDIRFESLPAPHTPPTKLPTGSAAVYVFACGTTCLLVDKADITTQTWYTKQHYRSTSSNSALARSILKYGRTQVGTGEANPDLHTIWGGLNNETVAEWLQTHTSRYHFFLEGKQPPFVLNLICAYLQCRLNPMFEAA